MRLGFQCRYSRRVPLRVLRVLAAVWLMVLAHGLIEESRRPPLPSPPDFDGVASPPPRVPAEAAGRDWPVAQETTPPSPFTSHFFESLLYYQAYDFRSAHYLPLPRGMPDRREREPEPSPAPAPPPPTEHLRYRGQFRHPRGESVAFVENLETGQTARFRVGERINGLIVEEITRHGLVLTTEQSARVLIVREGPVQRAAEPEAPAPLQDDPDPAETDPAETDPAEADPVEADPVEADPVEAEPVEAEPAEAEPAAS